MPTATTGTAEPGTGPGATRRRARQKRWWSVPPAPLDSPRLTTGRAYTEVLLVFGVFFAAGIAAAGFSVAGHGPTGDVAGWTQAIPGSIQQIATTILCILVPVLMVSRRGLRAADLGIAKPGTVGLSQGIRMAAWAVLALMAGGIVTGLLATGRFPEGPFSYPDLVLNVFHAAQAGFIEEIVVLAFVVVTLEQARRPRPEIIAVALVLRASYHIYYGPGVLGILVWAPLFLWLFLRFRTIIPLIIVHCSWDIIITFGDRWRFVTGLGGLGYLALFFTAFVLWLVARGKTTDTTSSAALAWPGWYADPGGTGGLRWFNGWAWGPVAYPAPTWPPVPAGASGRAPASVDAIE